VWWRHKPEEPAVFPLSCAAEDDFPRILTPNIYTTLQLRGWRRWNMTSVGSLDWRDLLTICLVFLWSLLIVFGKKMYFADTTAHPHWRTTVRQQAESCGLRATRTDVSVETVICIYLCGTVWPFWSSGNELVDAETFKTFLIWNQIQKAPSNLVLMFPETWSV